mmetsp:Transcript_14326/g.35977  ORF Transcript_14326/g.35977 Transcript_14326/m.35977 type:complete len:530 (-) Transcript_14326:159-1748(-)|eukprot:CAMPEP_0116109346 /NCGR_PEP_ID=MMETSP0327-20121206/17281_1 /TAXON_ID=44447 /ORGANISM="Pseudo-nitzschia delicatissima, Strain B596" /LENGTH=529 /DNA_ID=CAMNT_0003602341 /DNA_START=11 /DNA_END=1600 /DNA_ORIENTATION=-
MTTIRRRGGLFVASAAVCLVLLSSKTAMGQEANSLRGGRRSLISTNEELYYAELISNSRRLEGGEGGEEGGEEGGQEGEGGEGNNNNGEENGEKQEQQEQQYQEGNNNENQEKEENNDKNEEEGEQEQQQEAEEEVEQEAADEDAAEYNEEDVNEEGGADDDQSNFQNKVQDTVTNAQETMSELVDRFDEDVVNMWSTSPSEWNDELWKVFGVTAGIFTLLLSCILYVFCLCCKDDAEDRRYMETQEGGKRKKNHRGRLFNRMRTHDTDTVASGDDAEKPFVLIEDVENQGADDKSRFGPSTVYANSDAPPDVISPMSSKTGMTGKTGFDTHAGTPRSRHPMDDQTEYTMKTKRQKRGVFAETVDVWSEFLGFTKARSYNSSAFIKRPVPAEDDDIDETDDEITRRSKRRSSSKNSRKSRESRNSRQMRTGTYVAPMQEETEVVSAKSSTSASNKMSEMERVTAPTPVMSNVIAQAADKNSPRRTALMKTKNLLKSMGKNKPKIGNISSMESKEKSLASKNSKSSDKSM